MFMGVHFIVIYQEEIHFFLISARGNSMYDLQFGKFNHVPVLDVDIAINMLISSRLLPICCDVVNYKHFSYFFSYFCSWVTQHCCDLWGFTYVPTYTTGKLLIKFEIYTQVQVYCKFMIIVLINLRCA